MSSGESTECGPSLVSEELLEATVVSDPSPPEPPPMPTRVGRYEIEGTIGSGSMGMVLRARDPQLQRVVAVKILHSRNPDASNEKRMLREAQALAKLSHPNVIDVYDAGTVDGRVFIAMEYVAGHTLGRWLAERRPSTDVMLDAFIQAGQGLAAAHDAGLVHRDFKPANVLRGNDGRVRVLDFGLATPPRATEAEPTLGSLDGDPVDLRVTATGLVVGTPAYMAPEAHRGDPLDARGDQFSFCVALFEALWGKRPFPGPTPKDVAIQAIDGDIHFPSGVDVPGALRQVVLRGLRPSPLDRWPSMEDLLAQLRPRRRARWPWMIAGAGTAACLAAIVIAPALQPETCELAQQDIEKIWSTQTRGRVHTAFSGSGSSQAERTWDRVNERLAAHTHALADARHQACEARLEASAPAERLDHTIACLKRHQSELHGVISVLEEADAATVRNAVGVLDSLRSLEVCSDEALAAAIPPPPPEIAASLELAHQDMAEARGLLRAGHYEQAATMVPEIVERIEALEYRPALAEAQYLLARALEDAGRYDDAEDEMNEALMTAQHAGHDTLVANISTQLIYLVGNLLRRPDDAQRWVRHARAAVDRLPDPHEAATFLDSTLGNFYWGRGELNTARSHFARALQAYEEERGPRHPQTMIVRSNLAMVHHDLGENTKALELLERTLADRIEVYGPDHPEVSACYANLGNIEYRLGQFDASAKHTELALQGIEASVGREHPHYPQLLINLANNRFQQGRPDDALRIYDQSRELLSKSMGPRAFLVGRLLGNIGAIHHQLEHYEQARTFMVQARDIIEEHLEPEHPEYASVIGNIAGVDRETGRLEQSLHGYEQALTITEDALGTAHPRYAALLSGRADTYHAMERFELAVADLQRAATILHGAEIDPTREAEARFDLADVLWDASRPAEAVREMEQAKALVLGTHDEHDEHDELAPKIDAWLAEHPAPAGP